MTNEDHDTNTKLMEWSERKFQGKVNQKISNDIALAQVDLAKKLDRVKFVLGNIFSLYNKLCDFSNFTQETSQRIMSLERNLNIYSMQLPTNLAQSEKNSTQTLHTQRELVVLIEEEANTKEKLIQIQSSITLHLEVLHNEKMYAKIVLKKDSNLSSSNGLVHLATKISIQHKSLDTTLANWDAALKTLLEVNNKFLATHSINL